MDQAIFDKLCPEITLKKRPVSEGNEWYLSHGTGSEGECKVEVITL